MSGSAQGAVRRRRAARCPDPLAPSTGFGTLLAVLDPAKAAAARTFFRGATPAATKRIAALIELLPPLCLGLVAALMIVGVAGIDPRNVGWSSQGDSATHYLGWWFFRNSPWTFPLGANPDYGLEYGSSIFYSDSIPLFAFVFKLLSPWLPAVFQYLGPWTALCIVLQSWFAWKLLGTFESTRPLWVRLFAAGLFTFSPPLMIRVSGHSALCAQWVILASLYLYARGDERLHRVGWPLLAFFCSLVHSYLFVIVLALWFAACLQRATSRQASARVLAGDAALVLVPSLLGLWQAGFFMVRVEPAGGYGSLGTNLLAPLNPDIYSHVIAPVAPPFLGFHEGYAFLGLGCLLLVPILLPALLTRRFPFAIARRHWPLLLVLSALTAFAVTNRIAIGSLTLPAVPLPSALLELANVLRSSGRMFWPTFYVLVLALVLALAKNQVPRVSSRILAVALLAQVADTSRGWLKHHEHFAEKRASAWPTLFRSEFWQEAGAEYRRLRSVPLTHHADDYSMRAYYAALHGMATDSAYLARVDPTRLAAARARSEQAVLNGDFEPETLYILDVAHAAIAVNRVDPAVDLLTRVDGYYVLAPGWLRKPDRRGPPALPAQHFATRPGPEREILFGTGSKGASALGEGWSDPEQWGTWTDEARSSLLLLLEGESVPKQLELDVSALLADAQPTRDVECWLNGTLADTLHFDRIRNSGKRRVAMPIAAAAVAAETRVLDVQFRMTPPLSPKALGVGDDTRTLGMALRSIKLSNEP
jgi:hypothetical protein